MALDALIVDPNPVSRGYLWQATLAEANFRHVQAVSHLMDALVRLQSGYKFDVLLITSALELTEIKNFIPQFRQTANGKEAAYVLVVKLQDQGAENVAASLVDGTDGFLLEPYSVNSLRQVAAIAHRVKAEHEKERVRVAVQMVLVELMPKLDALAEAKRTKQDITAKDKDFKKAANGLRRVVGPYVEAYAEAAAEMFQKASPRAVRTSAGYKGASQRVREKFKE